MGMGMGMSGSIYACADARRVLPSIASLIIVARPFDPPSYTPTPTVSLYHHAPPLLGDMCILVLAGALLQALRRRHLIHPRLPCPPHLPVSEKHARESVVIYQAHHTQGAYPAPCLPLHCKHHQWMLMSIVLNLNGLTRSYFKIHIFFTLVRSVLVYMIWL
ncbi:hypothetical protein BDN71DRAFT_1459215 [Pleurotus eryngii]|uniref:Uncharacterized protein n=1 Tax=Pleurotus eryngii TaxID=5323 RepID=A0A9P5ZFP9_PLEER|nr:hypothetical protein BDN71DRAFT_1459215 [Pleurotus eryngii]